MYVCKKGDIADGAGAGFSRGSDSHGTVNYDVQCVEHTRLVAFARVESTVCPSLRRKGDMRRPKGPASFSWIVASCSR